MQNCFVGIVKHLSIVLIVFIVLLAVALPSPANADGGPIVPYDLWGNLEEGHQIGIVTILDDDRARQDLFISILDSTNVSHEITFFVPIGNNADTFSAYEQDLYSFDTTYTRKYDTRLRDADSRKRETIQVLFSGALLTNGGILIPLWAPLLLTGCAGAEPQAEKVITTASSTVSIFNIDDNTDISALIQTTGLPSAVADTLSGLKGQRVAIVKLQTQPQKVAIEQENPNPQNTSLTEPGLHLSWITQLVSTDKGKTVTYPLGTGAAWSKPIKLTRVYISARDGLDFSVQYPRLGEEHSGFERISGARILEYAETPAFAIDEARDSYGHLWRATYMQSNPTDNVIITVKPESAFNRFRTALGTAPLGYPLLFAFVIGILVWVLAWQYLMPLFLRKDPAYKKIMWYEALLYPAVNLVFMIVPGAIILLVFLFGITGPALAAQFLISAGVSIGYFILMHSKRLGVGRSKALMAFVLTSLCSSAAYLALAAGFAFLAGAI